MHTNFKQHLENTINEIRGAGLYKSWRGSRVRGTTGYVRIFPWQLRIYKSASWN